jgi:hypothetical protein
MGLFRFQKEKGKGDSDTASRKTIDRNDSVSVERRWD